MTEMYVHPNGGGDPPTGTDDASSVATATVDKVADEAAELKQQAGHEVGVVVDSAKDHVVSLADEARSRVKSEADHAAERAAAALHDTADELTRMAASVEDPGPAAQVVQKAGARVDDVADRLRRDGYDGVVRDVSRWARRNPGLFLLAAAGTGFVLGRVFRSVDPKGVADAARGTDAGTDVAAFSAPQDTVTGVGTMSPSPVTPPPVTPSPVTPSPVTPSPATTPMGASQPQPPSGPPVVDLSGDLSGDLSDPVDPARRAPQPAPGEGQR